MRRRPVTSRLWAMVMAVSLVFAQVALSAYACAMANPQAMAMAAMGPDCPEADRNAPQLCAKACQDEPQKQEAASLDELPPALDTGLRVETPEPRIPQGLMHGFALAHATSPPASILYSRFLE